MDRSSHRLIVLWIDLLISLLIDCFRLIDLSTDRLVVLWIDLLISLIIDSFFRLIDLFTDNYFISIDRLIVLWVNYLISLLIDCDVNQMYNLSTYQLILLLINY